MRHGQVRLTTSKVKRRNESKEVTNAILTGPCQNKFDKVLGSVNKWNLVSGEAFEEDDGYKTHFNFKEGLIA